MRKIYSLLILIFSFVTGVQAQVTVSGSTGADATYPSLTTAGGAFAALNAAGSQSGNTITISITADITTEDGVNSLNAGNWTAVNITPSGARTISGAVAGVLLNFNGADNVNINGLNTGGNSLIIENSNTGTTAATIRFIADAITNTVQNCTVKGSSTGATLGTIVFSTGTTSGNDGNIISGNTITTSSATVFPLNAIYSAGTSTAVDNSGISITSNNIQDYFGVATASNGILVASNSSAWTITGNRFFQSAARTATTGTLSAAINIITASGSGYTVSNNIIGYANSAGTGTTSYSGGANSFVGIKITTANTPVSSIQGNTVAGISISTSATGSQASPVFCGINMQSGGYNVGTTTGNTIGATSGTGSIAVTGTTTAFYVTGINVTSTGTVEISNNNVGSITAAGATSIGCLFYGIWTAGTAGNFTINKNLIGNTTTNSNSIQVGTNLTGTAATANQNFYGIRNDATGTIVIGASGAGNQVRNIANRSNSTAASYGIYNALATASLTIAYNTITDFALGWSDGTTGSGAFAGIYVLGTTTGSITFTNNNVQNHANLRTTGSCYGIYNSNATATVNVTNNIFNNLTRANAASGTFYGFYNASSPTGVYTFSNNTFSNITAGTAAGSSAFYGIYNLTSSSSTWNIFSNTITNNSAGTGTSYCIYDGYGGPASTCYNNTISGITTGGTLYGIYLGTSLTSTVGCYSNIISSLTTSGASSPLYGIYNAAITPSIYKNKIYTLLASGATATAYGIYTGGGTTLTIHNNLIGDIKATTSSLTAPAPSVAGLYISSGTTVNAYFNTLYLSATSSGTNFGSAAVYATATPTTVNLRNNIFVNNSTPNGTGKAVAYQRSSSVYTNYANTSNNNDFYAGNAAGLIFFDGANSDATIAAYKTRMATRDQSSFSESPSFISTTGSNAGFLHITNGAVTQLESGGQAISGITDDYDGDTRDATNPDIGADEFVGTSPAPDVTLNSFVVTGTSTPGATAQCTAAGRDISVNASATGGTLTSVNITYNNGTSTTVPMNGTLNTASGTFTYTIPAATPSNTTVTWSVTATNSGGLSFTYPGTSYTDEPLTGTSVSSTAASSTICSGSSATITTTLLKPTTATIGTQTTTLGAVNGNPLRTSAGSPSQIKAQLLYKASELTAAGLKAGNITALGFTVTGAAGSMSNYTIKMAHTSLSALTTTLETPTFTTVFTTASYTPVVGVNMHTFSTPFNWDGTSNIIVDVCQTNNVTGTTTVGAMTPGFAANTYVTPSSTACAATTGNAITTRPLITFTGNGAFAVTAYSWSDGTSTVGTTNPLVITPPANNTTSPVTYNYTPTLTAAGCPTTGSPVTITVNPLPSAPNTVDGSQCGAGIPVSGIASSSYGTASPTFNWYYQGAPTTLLQSSTVNHYNSVISTGSDFLVAEQLNGCEGPKSQLRVDVSTPGAFSITGSQTICNGTILQLLANGTYNQVSWTSTTPGTLYTDGTATTPYTAGAFTSSIYYKSTTARIDTVIALAYNTSTSCGNTDSSFITVQPGNISISAADQSLCQSGSTVISASPSSGYAAGSTQWQSSTDNVTFTDIPGATGTTYTTPTLTSTKYYKFLVSKSGGAFCAQLPITITVNTPAVTGTTPGSRCGVGTVNLGATGNGGSTLNWYAASTGGASLSTGTTFTTPSLSSTTTFYVSATQGGTSGSLGLADRVGSTTNTGYSDVGLMFDAASAFTLYSVAVYPVGTGGSATLSIALKNSAGTVLQSTTVTVNTAASPGVKTVVPLNFAVPVGTNHRLVMTAATGLTGLIRESSTGYTYPYTLPGVASITSAYTGGASSAYYYYFYDWLVSTGCESARTPVIATITTPPAITPSVSAAIICNGASSTLGVTSSNNAYSYTWTPGNLTGATQTVSPSSTTKYYVTAFDGSCTAVDSVTVEVQPNATLTADNLNICVSGSTTLSANPATGYAAGTLQWQSSPDNLTFTDIAGETNPTYTSGTLTSTTYYKLLVKNSAGGICSQPVKTITVNNPQVTGTTPGSRCGPGTVTLGATGTAGSSFNWYSASTGGTALSTGSSFVTPSISSNTTYYVSASTGGSTFNTSKLTYEASSTATVLTTYGQDFTVTTGFTLNSVQVFSTTGTSITVSLYSSGGATQLYTTGAVAVTAGSSPNIPIGWYIPPGTYRLCANGMTGNFYRDNTGVTYPFALSTIGTMNGFVSAITGSVTTSSSYYFMYNWSVTTGCESGRTAVTATVTPATPITPSISDAVVCSGGSTTLGVTSTNTNYTYTWTPGNLTGATQTITPVSSRRFYVTASDGVCNAIDSVDVIVQPSATISSSVPSICVSGSSVLSASPATGFGANTLQWQSSPDNSTFSDIATATGVTYTTPTLTSTTYYKLLIKNSAGSVCSAPNYALVVNNPQVLTSSGVTRCGPGTATLSGTASAGAVLSWYAASTGGTALASGNTYTTPVIAATTTYYVAATQGGTTASVGKVGTTASPSSGSGTTNFGLVFDALVPFTLQSVVVYPVHSTAGTPGTITIDVINSSGTVLNTATVNVTGYPTSALVGQRVNLNFNVAAGTNLKLRPGSFTGITGIAFDPSGNGNYAYPYSVPGTLDILYSTLTAAPTNTQRLDLYYYFYDWRVTTGCESGRTPVIATVNTAPSITASKSADNVCASATTTLSVVSANTNYTYNWTPGNLPGSSISVTPSTTTKYYVTSTDAGTTCQNIDSVTVNVQPVATISSSAPDICVSGSVTLSANPSTGYAANTLQWQSSSDNITFTNIAGATSATYTTPTITSTKYYKLVIKNGTNSICSEPVKTVTVNNPLVLSTTPRTICGVGAAGLKATPSAGATIKWYAAATGGTAIATGSNFTTPIISSTTTYYAAATAGGGSTQTSDPRTPNVSTSTVNSGVLLDINQSTTLISVDIFPTTAGDATIVLQNSAGTVIQGPITVSNLPVTTYTAPITVNLGWALSIGTGYRLLVTTHSSSLGYSSGTFPASLGNSVGSITGGWTGSSSSTLNYYFYNLKTSTACESGRTPVVATVTSATPITASSNVSNVCKFTSATLSVTSSNANYTYEWSTDESTSSITVTPSNTTKYFVYANDPISGCTYVDSVTISVQPSPIISATSSSICSSGSTVLSANPSTGYGANTLQWQSSSNNSTFTDIGGATSATYTTPTLTTTTYYKLVVKDASAHVCSTPQTTITVNNPAITGSAGGSRCGTGSVILAATGSPGAAIKWYNVSTGGLALSTGSSFTTPSISSTTTYYAAATIGSTIKSLGLADRVGSTTNTGYSDVGLMFDATTSFVLQSVAMYPVGTASSATLSIALKNSAGTVLQSTTVTVTPSASPGIKTIVPLNFSVPAGTGHRLVMTAATGLTGLIRELTTGFTYPYTLPGVASITSAYTGGASASYYYYFYDWKVTAGCESARTPVVATVNPASAPTVSIVITSGTNPTCAGGPITFTATPVNGGSQPSYQWKKDGANVGTNSNKYTDPGNTPGTISVTLTSNSTCASTPTANSNSIAFTINVNSWTGATSSDWNTGSNWCSGTIPTIATDVTIPSGTPNAPKLTNASFVKNLTIQSGATVNLSLFSLTVAGTLSGTGKFAGTSQSTLTFTGTGNIGTLNFASGSEALGSLVFSGTGASMTLGSALSIYGELDVKTNTLSTGGLLTIKSAANGTGNVAPINGGNVSGAVTVERYIPSNGHPAWRLLSVPTQTTQTFHQAWQENQAPMVVGTSGLGTLITSPAGTAQGFDATTQGTSLLKFNQVTGGSGSFTGVSSTNLPMISTATTTDRFAGYFLYIRGDRNVQPSGGVYPPNATTLRTNGPLYIGTQPAITVPANTNVLVGNIYASAIDFATLTKTNINSFKVWDPKLLGTSNLGAYQTFSASTGYDPVPGGGSYGSTPNSRIESGQAFIVSSSTGGSIQFTEAAKTTGSRNVFRTNNTVKQFKTNLYAETQDGPQLADGNSVVFDDAYSTGTDEGDVVKAGNIGEDFAISSNNMPWVIESRKSIGETDVVQYSMKKLRTQEYTLEFLPKNMAANITGYLEDKFTGSKTPVSMTDATTVRFTVTADAASKAEDRFRIVFSNKTSPVMTTEVKAYVKNKDVQVDWKVKAEQNVRYYEVEHSADGNNFSKAATVAAKANAAVETDYGYADTKAVRGDNWYRIRAVSTTGEAKYTSAVKVTIGKENSGFNIYPNPIVNSRVNVEFKNQAEGKYTINLVDKTGAVKYSTTVSHTASTNAHSLALPSSLAAGTYQIEIVSNEGDRSAYNVIIANK